MITLKRALGPGMLLILVMSMVSSVDAVTFVVGSQITSNNTQTSGDPSLMYYRENNTVWSFYSIQGLNGNFDIYYRILNPNCLQSACLLIFYPQRRLTTGPGSNLFSSAVETPDGTVWVFFGSDRAGGSQIFYKTFDGVSWSPDIQFTSSGFNNDPFLLSTSFEELWVAWASSTVCRSGCAASIALRTFNGTAWSPVKNVTSYGLDFQPSLSQAGDGTVWVTWARITGTGQHDIFYTTLDFNGVPGPEVQLTSGASDDFWPSVVSVAASPVVAIVWASNRNMVFDTNANKNLPEYDLFMKYSLNGGSSWSAEAQIYQNPATNPPRVVDNTEPSALQYSSGRIGIVWVSDLTGSSNIFSMTLLMADAAVAAINTGVQAAGNSLTVLARNETLNVNMTLTNMGWEPETVTVSLYANATLLGTSPVSVPYLGSATASFTWDTHAFNKGTYILKAVAGNLTGEANPNNNILATTIKLTIPSDVNGDRTVNILDLVSVALAFGTSRGSPGYSANADVTRDGTINVLDLVYVALRFGQTG